MSKIFDSAQSLRAVVISDHVTPWLTVRNCHQRKLFDRFKRSQTNIYALVFVQLVALCYIPFEKYNSYEYFPSGLTLANLILGFISPVLLGIIVLYTHIMCWYTMKCVSDVSYFGIHISLFESFWVVGWCMSFGLAIIVSGYNGLCPTDDFQKSQGCGYSAPHQMPEDMMMISLVLPPVLLILIKGVRWEFAVTGLFVVMFANLFAMFNYDLTESLPSFLMFLPLCILLLYESHRQSITLFLLSQNQEDLLQENERLAAETHANELRHMIGNVAHDLKTPLSAFVSGMDLIVSLLSELRADTTISSDSETKVASIGESIDNMKNVNAFMLMTINRCIDYTKASNGLKLVPRLETVNFADTLALPLNCMKNLQNSNIEIKLLAISDKIAANIITDKQWLQENILCLLSNAVKYSAGGVVTVSASLTAHQRKHSDASRTSFASLATPEPITGQAIRIEVEDTGIGISEENMTNLFNPFKQAQRLAGGTGLGLYSLAKRIEALGGNFGVEGRASGGQGSCFWFTIPYRPDNTAMDSHPDAMPPSYMKLSQLTSVESSATSMGDQPQQRKLNILLADDAISILKMCSMVLRRQGHTVTTAENGAQALETLTNQFNRNCEGTLKDEERFDVVLMDLQMPIMDGLEATSRLRKLELVSTPPHVSQDDLSDSADTVGLLMSAQRNSSASYRLIGAQHQLIIGVSANSDNDTMEAAFAAGIDAFIPKPFSIQVFESTYRGLMIKHEQQQHSSSSVNIVNKIN